MQRWTERFCVMIFTTTLSCVFPYSHHCRWVVNRNRKKIKRRDKGDRRSERSILPNWLPKYHVMLTLMEFPPGDTIGLYHRDGLRIWDNVGVKEWEHCPSKVSYFSFCIQLAMQCLKDFKTRNVIIDQEVTCREDAHPCDTYFPPAVHQKHICL